MKLPLESIKFRIDVQEQVKSPNLIQDVFHLYKVNNIPLFMIFLQIIKMSGKMLML